MYSFAYLYVLTGNFPFRKVIIHMPRNYGYPSICKLPVMLAPPIFRLRVFDKTCLSIMSLFTLHARGYLYVTWQHQRDSSKTLRFSTVNKNQWPKRLYALDVSRGLASIAVVLWHWEHFSYSGDQEFTREYLPLYGILRLFYENGDKGVQYFFILSGFIFYWLYRSPIKDRKTSAWEFGIQRFSRLYPLHFATLIAVAILQFTYISREGVSFVYSFNDTFHFFLNLGFASSWGFETGPSFNAPIWSVSIEVLLYFFFFLTALFFCNGFFFCLTISALSSVLFFIYSHTIFVGLAMFFLGGLVFHLAVFLTMQKHKLTTTLAYTATLVAWVSVLVDHYVFALSNNILNLGVQGQPVQFALKT